MRTAVPCVIGERSPPASVVDRARAVGAPCRILGRDYGFRRGSDHWAWWGDGRTVEGLPPPGPAGSHQVDNAATCLAALSALSPRIRLSDDAVRTGIANARIAGRLEWIHAPERVLVDVAHNPLGAEALAAYLASFRPRPRRRAVCGVLGDKDAGAMLRALLSEIDAWYFASLPGSRGRDAQELAGELPGAVPGLAFDSVEAAFMAALEGRSEHEEVVVFGSFVTVERVLRLATSAICPET